MPGIVPDKQMTVCYGAPKEGKSAWAQKLAMCVNTGAPFDGLELGRGGRVLYVTLDPGADKDEVSDRFDMIAEQIGLAPDAWSIEIVDARRSIWTIRSRSMNS